MTRKMIYKTTTVFVIFSICLSSFQIQLSHAVEVLCSKHEFNMALVHLKTCSIQEPRIIQQKLLNGQDFCTDINEFLFRCLTPIRACLDKSGVTEVANALLHDVVPLDRPKLFKNIKEGKNCSEIAKNYAGKKSQPSLESQVCNHVESWEIRHEYEICKERSNVAMKLKLAQNRGQRQTLMKNVCSTVDRLVNCGRKLNQCLTTSEIELINASLLDNLEKLLAGLKHKTGFEANYCKAFSNKRKRPEIMDRQDDQPVRLASPSVNVLDYSKRRGSTGRYGRGGSNTVKASMSLLVSLLLVSSIIKHDIT